MLFRKDFRSENSFQLSPFAWPSRSTLKVNVTSACIVLPQLFFLFRKVFGSGNSFSVGISCKLTTLVGYVLYALLCIIGNKTKNIDMSTVCV